MSPLSHRFPRELRHDLGKYLGMFALLVMAIMFTSGFLSSAESIASLAASMREDYRIEDLYFTTMYEAPAEAIQAVEHQGASVHENFSRDVALEVADAPDREMSVRLYRLRDGSFDGVAYASGRVPQRTGEVALDRVFCQNHSLSLGDMVRIAGEDFELVGICTLADYQVTYKNAGDFMFNASSFTVAQLVDDDWERLVGEGATFRYSVLLDDRDADLATRVAWEEDLVDIVNDHDATVTDLVDRESNIGLTFAADDIESDSRMWMILLVILIVIMAFVFVVLTDATLEAESAVIGTLLASGFRKRELIGHYMALPTLIGLLGCLLGIVLGATLMSGPMQGLYYTSYSFPPYVHEWHGDVIVSTAVVPFVLLVGITWLGLVRKLRATPLQFLRGEAVRRTRRGGTHLPERLPFPLRFRLRVFLRNLSHFATLFFGILFGSLLLLMGLALLPIVSINADLMAQSVPAEHLYTLKAPLVIDATQAQRDAWAAAFELETNPDYDALDLELLSDLAERLEDAGVRLDEIEGLGEGNDDGAVESIIPPALETMVEDSVDDDGWNPADAQVHVLWRMAASAAGVELDCTEDELTRIIETADAFHRQLHAMDDDALERAWGLLEDLMEAARDPSVDLSEMEDPVNQTPIGRATLDQVERFAVTTLSVPRRIGESNEEVTVYGIEPNSRYWTYADVSGGRTLAGGGVLQKCVVDASIPFSGLDRTTNDRYELVVDAACGNDTDMNVYMDIDAFNELFGKEGGSFNGFASEVELPLDERYVASDLTPDKMRSMADQMEESMGSIMRMMVILVIPLYLVLIYLLTKTVIDRSARAISYMKVFGYHDRDVVRLYVRTITVTVVTSLVASVPILTEGFKVLVRFMMAEYSGNLIIEVPFALMAEEVAIGLATYVAVAALHLLAIRRIPLALAMKVTE